MNNPAPSDAPPSRLLVLEADQLAVIAACGQPMHAGQVATLARRLRDIAADVDATERMKAGAVAVAESRATELARYETAINDATQVKP